MTYLLDTNVCLDFLLARYPGVAERIRREYGKLHVSTVSVAELRVGNRTSSDPVGDATRIDAFVTLVPPRPFDAAAATAYGTLVRRVSVKRQSFDRLIAAHAIALGMTLVTSDSRDFEDVPGLAIEDWR